VVIDHKLRCVTHKRGAGHIRGRAGADGIDRLSLSNECLRTGWALHTGPTARPRALLRRWDSDDDFAAVAPPLSSPLGFGRPNRSSDVDEVVALRPADLRRSTVAFPLTPDVLCDTYGRRVFKFAQLVSADSSSAEDLAQDALERALRGLSTFDPTKGDVEAWLWRIVVNASRDAGRIARRQRLIVEVLADRWLADEKVFDVGDIRTDDLLSAIRTLSSRHRAVVALRYGADLAYRDVGQILGISEAAALMSTRRALAILRRRLKAQAGQT
jgi:RNA polymerase sigma-70 factor, ECF subfamily